MSAENDMKTEAKRQLKDAQDPMDKLRLQCLARGCCGIKDFARVFSIMDENGIRKLDFDEFCRGMKDFGVKLNDHEVKTLFDSMDKNNSGFIDYDEFLVALRPPMSKNRQKIVAEAFRKLDRSGDGKVTVDDLRGVYNAGGHPKFKSGQMTEDQVFAEFLRNFQIMGEKMDDVVTKDEFFNYYSGLSASIDNDAYFDLMMRNAWKL
uniref:EF-hand domain-containing protein n=1 Tax=Romanomermis culicivorax TaxID=13658 RepID=A0A915LA90_ROMCU